MSVRYGKMFSTFINWTIDLADTMQFTWLQLLFCCSAAVAISLEDQFTKLSRQKRYLTIPYGSAIGMILAFAVPLDLPASQDVLMSWNMEGNYNLPDQLYYFGTPPPLPDLNQDPDLPDPVRRSLRDVSRHSAYQLLTRRIAGFGLDGEACLLRAICEVSQTSLHHNGLMGQLLHIIFSPSLSKSEALCSSYMEAEDRGTKGEDCQQLYPSCPVSFVEQFTSEN